MTSKLPLISVIVPIYNVEKYLSQCIESIVAQNYKNLEIFLVDDGSPDQCGSICDSFAEKDSRIKVVHKTNGGLSDARNFALEQATGDYITFVDSDDYLSKDYVNNLFSLVSKYSCQIAITNFYMFREGDRIEKVNNDTEIVFSRDEGTKNLMYQKYFDNNATAKLYAKALFQKIRYPKGLLYEDVPTTYKLFLLADKIAYANKQDYYYLLRNDSIEGSHFSVAKYNSVVAIIEDLEKAMDLNPIIAQSVKCRILSLSFHLFFETENGSIYEKKLLDNIKRYRFSVITDNNARIKTRLAAFLSYFGNIALRSFYNFGKSR